jgi:hypothetical protein
VEISHGVGLQGLAARETVFQAALPDFIRLAESLPADWGIGAFGAYGSAACDIRKWERELDSPGRLRTLTV